jgi:hypothetical protein
LFVIGALAVALALGDSAQAINRKQADRIAMKVMKTKSKKDVTLFRDARRLKLTDALSFVTRKRVPVSKKGFPRVGAPAWLYWHDLASHAGFERPSEMLLIHARTGKVLKRKRLR